MKFIRRFQLIDQSVFGSKAWCFAILVSVLMIASPLPANAEQPERWAILIGIDNYFDLTPLSSSSKDAVQFGEILQERCGFSRKNISVVVDQPAQLNRKAMLDVRYKTLRERLKNFIHAAEQGNVQTLVVYYSGHGCAVLPADGAKASDLLLPAIDAAEADEQLINALSKNEIQQQLAAADIPEKLLILDCCHASQPDQVPLAGKAIHLRAASHTTKEERVEKRDAKVATDSSFVILAGSAFEQVAGEQVFTKHLVEGLSVLGDSASDIDQNQQIEIDELYRHVQGSMSVRGGQTPSMQVISGSAGGISIAPVVLQPDPERLARVYVLSHDNKQLNDAQVKLVFSDIDRGESVILASATTDERGRAILRYQFGTTRDRQGRFRISVTHRGDQVGSAVTNLSNFANSPSPSDFKIKLPANQPSFSGDRPREAPNRRPPVRSVMTVEPTFQEVLKAVTDHVRDSRVIPDICSFQKHFPEYNQIMKGLKRSEKLRLSGTVICFPGKAIWGRDPRLRANVIRILTAEGIINQDRIADKRSFAGRREPTFDVVKNAAFGFVEQIDADVCGLVEYVAGYKETMDTLGKGEKFEVLPGLPICFPSQAAWERNPEIRQRFIRVLRESHVLDQ